MKTVPKYSLGKIGCTRLTIKFKDRLRQVVEHSLGSPTAAHLMVVGFVEELNSISIDYVSRDNVILRSILVAREEIHELSVDEGVCEIAS